MGNVLWGISLLSRYSTEKYGPVADEVTLIELESEDSKISDDVEAVLIIRGVGFVAWRGVGNVIKGKKAVVWYPRGWVSQSNRVLY